MHICNNSYLRQEPIKVNVYQLHIKGNRETKSLAAASTSKPTWSSRCHPYVGISRSNYAVIKHLRLYDVLLVHIRVNYWEGLSAPKIIVTLSLSFYRNSFIVTYLLICLKIFVKFKSLVKYFGTTRDHFHKFFSSSVSCTIP